MPRAHDHDGPPGRRAQGSTFQGRQGGGRGGLDEDSFAPRQLPLGREDFVVGHALHPSVRGPHRAQRLVPTGGTADVDGAGDGPWILLDGRRRQVSLPGVHQGRRALRLHAHEPGAPGGRTSTYQFIEALPDGADVARVAHGKPELAGRPTT